MTHINTAVQAVKVGSKVDQFIAELEKDEAAQSVIPETSLVINHKGTQLLIKSRVVPAGISKNGEAYDAFTVLEVFRPGKVSNGKIRPIGKAYLVRGMDEDGQATDEIVGYRLRLNGFLKGGSTASTKEVVTPCFGIKFSIEPKYSEKKKKDYIAIINDEGSVVGFANDYYNIGMKYSYTVVAMVK